MVEVLCVEAPLSGYSGDVSLSDHAWDAVQMNVERLQKMAGTVRTGGKGTVRR